MLLADVVAAFERRYDPAWAESWDAVGLACGDPAAEVTRVHFAIDPTEAVAAEAIASGAQLLVTHHPLYLGGTESVAATNAKGRVIHRLITNRAALFVAHTNADVAPDIGVNDALAAAIGLTDVTSIDPAKPATLGRVGSLPAPMTLRDFTAAVAKTLPATVWGVRAAGDPDRTVRRVVVAGGACIELADPVAAIGADVLLTSDVKHHRTSDAVVDHGLAIVDAAHWATEQPWLSVAADVLAADAAAAGTTVECTVSRIVTDPFTLHAHAAGDEERPA